MTPVVNIHDAPFDIYVGRPTKWGNPFRLRGESDRLYAIASYARWILERPDLLEDARAELRGKVLGCHCAPRACHATILAVLAEEGSDGVRRWLEFVDRVNM